MLRILAIDPGTNTGWAHSTGISGVWDLRIRRDESSGMRLIRLRAKLDEILRTVGVDVVVFEAARHKAPGMQGALVVHAEIQGQIKAWCEQNSIQYRGYSPAEIKKYASGSGNCSKEKMLKLAQRKWKNVIDHNHGDALWLLELAHQELK